MGFSSETMVVRRQWNGIVQVLKGKSLQPGMLFPAKLSLRNEGEKEIYILNSKNLLPAELNLQKNADSFSA